MARPKSQDAPNITFDVDLDCLKAIKAAANLTNMRSINYGIIDDVKYPNGTYVAEAAKVQEYGLEDFMSIGGVSVDLPPRPFFGQSLVKAKVMATKFAEGFFTQTILSGKNNSYVYIDMHMQVMASQLANTVRQAIDEQNFTDISQSTKDKKGRDDILKDTNLMYNSMKGEVMIGRIGDWSQ